MIKHGLLLVFGMFTALAVWAQSGSGSCVKSTEGKEFWFGFMENRNYQVPQFPTYLPVVHFIEIALVSEQKCNVSIFIGKSPTPNYSETVYPNVPLQLKIPWQDVEAMGSETIQNKAIHLISDNPLNLYAFNWCEKSSDVAVIYPKESLGKEYLTLCYTPNISSYFDILGFEHYGSGRNSEFLVVATEDNTTINITPSKTTDLLHPANQPFTIVLNKGEIYQVQSLNFSNLPGQGDLTGSSIQSDKPIALFSGSLATTVPAEKNVDAWDHLYEQIPPLQSWGRKFVAVPIKGRSKDVFRVLASNNNTQVRIGDKLFMNLNRGEYKDFELNENEPMLIESNHPVLLAQYMISNSVDRPADRTQYDWDGDPFMVIVSPVDQTRESVTFLAYNSTEITDKYYVNIAAKDDAATQILLDNVAVPFQLLEKSGYSFARVKIGKGAHNLKSKTPGKGFVAFVYGYGGVESYGYGVGYNLSTQLDLGGDIQFARDTMMLCKGESRTLDAGSHFATFQWNNGATSQKLDVTTKGYYEVTATTADGCKLTDGIQVLENNKVVNLLPEAVVCLPGTLSLDAGEFSSFKWSTNETTKTISVDQPGKYSVIALDKYGCSSMDTVVVSTANRPKLITNLLDTVVCGGKSTTVKLSADQGNYSLISSDPTVAINGLTATVPDYGYFPLTFQSKDQNSCITDTTFRVHFRNGSSPSILIDNTCQGYSLDAGYSGNAPLPTTHFTWILGGDTLVSGLGKYQIHKSLGNSTFSSDLTLQVMEQGCPKQQVSQTVTLSPDLDFVIADSVLCLESSLKAKAIHSQSIRAWEWDWGDGTIESASGDASHSYLRDGSYSVGLTATTVNNCKNTIFKKNLVTVAPIPSVDFSLKSDVCLDPGIQSISFVGNAGVGDQFIWDLSAFLPGEIISDPGKGPGPLRYEFKSQPQAKIALQVISGQQCHSEWKSINLKQKPQFSFISPGITGCEPLAVTWQAEPTGKADEISFFWNFGDGNTGQGDQAIHSYKYGAKPYSLSLIATSSVTGCIDSLRKSDFITVMPAPEAAFIADQQLFLTENPTVSFTNKSSGASQFTWEFGDGTRSEEKNPSHQYFVTGKREVVLQATNEFGCQDTAKLNIAIALARIYAPNAFAPNAIYEIDREFKPNTKDVQQEGYHLMIFSRWNDLIFECRDEISGWNGKMSNGENAPSGTYIWILEYNDFLGKPHRQRGTVVLIN